MTHPHPPCFRRVRRLREEHDRDHHALVAALQDAVDRRHREALERILHFGVTLTVDGGGLVPAPAKPVTGRIPVASALLELLAPGTHQTSEIVSANAQPALLFCHAGRAVAIIIARVRRRRAAELWLVLNPEKLRHWNKSQ